jgi:formylglycine-generating enzyme required for sulfatase activity
MLPPNSADEHEQVVQRFKREARAAARLNHPNLVRIFDVDEHGGLLYQVLEYAEGGSVAGLVRREGSLSVQEALRIVLEAAQGVACAHRSGIVHRDLKPGNLLLDGKNSVKVADLGLAGLLDRTGEELTLSSQRELGTPGYMPPEQQEALKRAGKPADIWALGSTFYTLLVGRRAFAGETGHEIMQRVKSDDFPGLPAYVDDVPRGIREVLAKATRRRPEDRYQDAFELAAALEEAKHDIGRGPTGVSNIAALLRAAGTRPQASPKPSRLVVPGFRFLTRNRQGYDEYHHEKTGLIFVLLPGGRFRMGSPKSEFGRHDDEGPVHEVELSRFLIAKHQVTQVVWVKLMRTNPSHFKGEEDLPVDSVSWEDCKAFCETTGLDFPTEAQWEYAARGGTETPFSFGETITTDQVNYDGNGPYGSAPRGTYRQKTVPVGSLPPNPFGLHEVHGNLYESCFDVYDGEFYGNREAREKDPRCKSGSAFRVLRGGSWYCYARRCRSARRFWNASSYRWFYVGFRPAVSRLATV